MQATLLTFQQQAVAALRGVGNFSAGLLQRFLALDKKTATLLLVALLPSLYAFYRALKYVVLKLVPVKVYVRDFAVFQTNDPAWKYSNTQMLEKSQKMRFNGKSLDFFRKLSKNNGIGSKTAYPPQIFTTDRNVEDGRDEVRAVVFPTVRDLLEKTGIKANEIDVLVTNCSMFVPTPSLSSIIINEFKMKKEIHNFSLGGMGCSASPLGVDIVQAFLRDRNLKYAVLVSTEILTSIYYEGNEPSMLLAHTLFRAGCAAILFTNVNYKCKYELKHIVRTHIGADDNAHKCINLTVDSDGTSGVRLEKTIIKNASKGLMNNVPRVLSKVMPLSLKLDYALRMFAQFSAWYFDTRVRKIQTTYPKFGNPKFAKAIQNFCIHTGGRGVLDSLQEQFGLSDELIAASRASLYMYGNTSSASIWYELAYHEHTGAVQKGNTVWQVAFGSGFKCNSVILKALKTVTKETRTLFDRFNPDYVFDPKEVERDVISPEMMKADFEKIAAENQKTRDDAEWEKVKLKFSDRIAAEQESVKQTPEISVR
ncbi:3-ketoacyl-CoA_synthase [Hexamita inflata]|uniref:very-long-chain 3-oxoacyl-CoA synthase n=1 Tax=Hexamita inflata TaxID=28002 RepID=A0AA86P0F4_9EUKA|nr:3-ketoacyl-CoA synthase [Hexamita inflata]